MHRSKILAAAAGLLLFHGTAVRAQWAEKKTLTLEGAKRVIAGSVAEARRRNTTGVVAVVDDGGNLMAVERLDGTFAAGALISIGKARTAALFKKPTKAFEDVINKGRTAMTTVDFTPLQGGVPIVVDGAIVGAVGVSGASSAQEDEELASAGASALTAEAPVSYFEAPRVREAFSKGAVLFDGQGRNYMVHASRRDAAGQAEIHAKDADIIYVLEGTATLVTGGTVVEPKTTAPDEVRGKEIVRGEPRTLSKGDVVIVPAGTPHWFEKVPAAFTYYVVKVRS
jgi:glc operon protein GlcG